MTEVLRGPSGADDKCAKHQWKCLGNCWLQKTSTLCSSLQSTDAARREEMMLQLRACTSFYWHAILGNEKVVGCGSKEMQTQSSRANGWHTWNGRGQHERILVQAAASFLWTDWIYHLLQSGIQNVIFNFLPHNIDLLCATSGDDVWTLLDCFLSSHDGGTAQRAVISALGHQPSVNALLMKAVAAGQA